MQVSEEGDEGSEATLKSGRRRFISDGLLFNIASFRI